MTGEKPQGKRGRPYCWFRDINYKGTSYHIPIYYQETIPSSENETASSAEPCVLISA